MTKTIDRQLDDILDDFSVSFFDDDAFFKQQRRERMRPNLSRNENEENATDITTIGSLITSGYSSENDE